MCEEYVVELEEECCCEETEVLNEEGDPVSVVVFERELCEACGIDNQWIHLTDDDGDIIAHQCGFCDTVYWL